MPKKKIKKIKKIIVEKPRVKKVRAAKKMPAADLKKYKDLLVKERDRIANAISHITDNTLKTSQRDASGDLSGYSYHMADMASDDYERDFSLSRATEDQKVLYFIDEAIKRIKDGSYGSCLECGGAIAKSRLNALPYAEVCIECQKKKDIK